LSWVLQNRMAIEKVKTLARVVLFIALCVGAGWAIPAKMGPIDVAQAFFLAKLMYGESGDAPLPAIRNVSKEKLREVYGCKYCDVYGVYILGEAVYLDEDIDFSIPFEATTLFHELVHYLQWRARGKIPNCAEWFLREQQAFTLEADLLEKFYLDRKGASLSIKERNNLTCED